MANHKIEALFNKNLIRLNGISVDSPTSEESLYYYYFIGSVSLFICLVLLMKTTCQWCCLLCNWNIEYEGVQSNLEAVTVNLVNENRTYGAINDSQMNPLVEQNNVLQVGRK